jgi:hypothetical protein
MYLTAKKKERNSGHERDAVDIVCLKFSVMTPSFQRFQSQQQSSANSPQHQY